MDKGRADALKVLGLPADSDADAVAHAYRRLARMTHPDVSADPQAADRFATLAAAYRVASRASAVVGRSASTGKWGLADGGPSFRDGTPRGRPHQQAPIVAGPVFVSPTRHAGPRGGS